MPYVSQDSSTFDNSENFATLPMNEIGDRLEGMVDDYYYHCRNAGWTALWQRCYKAYHKGFFTRGMASRRGLAGELVKVNINHFRNMILHVINMITAQRPSFDPRAANSDYRSMAQTDLAKGLLDYYMRQKGLENYLKDAAEYAMVYGEGFIIVEWDHTIGEDVAPEEETTKKGEKPKIIKSGDITYYNCGSLDVIRDYNVKNYKECEWTIVRTFKNKFDVAEQFPEFADEIKKLCYKKDTERDLYVWMGQRYSSDSIPVYTFYHKPSILLPQGRRVQFIDGKTVLTDSTLIANDYPVKRISPNEMNDTPYGYTSSFEMLELQDHYNSLSSSIATNQEMFGTQTIAIEKGSGFETDNFGPMKLITINPGSAPPFPIQLTKTAPEIFEHLNTVEMNMEKIVGINSVVRGMPIPSLESGSALALIQQTAIQFNSAYEMSYNKVIEEVGESIVKNTQAFATTPRVALITGKSNRWYLKEYKGTDIGQIERVIVDRGNPMSKTTAGKIQIAQDLFKMGMLKTAEQYIMVLQTGRIEPVVEGKQAELMFIKDENEQLAEGIDVEAAMTDNDDLHIREHMVVTFSRDARADENLMSATLKHIGQHIENAKTKDPQLMMIIGQQPPPQMEEGMNPELLTNNTNNAAMEYPDMPEMPEPAQMPIGA
jgi:hypothetical protein